MYLRGSMSGFLWKKLLIFQPIQHFIKLQFMYLRGSMSENMERCLAPANLPIPKADIEASMCHFTKAYWTYAVFYL